MAKKGRTLEIAIPRYFQPLLQGGLRYRAVYGGRASSKSHTAAEWIIAMCVGNPGYRVLCGREIQKSLNQSVKQLLADKIQKFGLEKQFDIQQSVIKTPGDGMIIFSGLQSHTADSIKSLEGFDLAWIEEASTVSQYSLDLLRPTIRKPGSSILFTYNPRSPKDPVDKFLRGGEPPPNSAIVKANYMENPFLPDVMLQEARYDKERDFEKYRHVWLGEYLVQSEANVFKNWRTEYFDTPEDARFFYGLDFGYSKDPTFLTRCFIGRYDGDKIIPDPKGRTLFVDYESVEYGCEIDKLPDLLDKVPGSRDWAIRADNARPEVISWLQRNGFPKVCASKKGAGSIIEGVEFIRAYDVVIHERCPRLIDNFTYYRWQQDSKTEEILPKLEDKNNDGIDSLRYGIELLIRSERSAGSVSSFVPKMPTEGIKASSIEQPEKSSLYVGCKML